MNKLRPSLLLLLCATIPVLVVGVVIGEYFLRQQRAAIDRDIAQRADFSATGLARALEMQRQLLSVVSESPRLDPPLERKAFKEIAHRLLGRIPVWQMLHISDLHGNIVLSVPTPEDGASHSTVNDMESYRRVIESRTAVVGSVVRREREIPTFPIRVPVERDGTITSILTALIRPEEITNILYANGLAKTWTAWIADGDGRLVAATGAAPALIGGPLNAFVRDTGSEGSGIAGVKIVSGEDVRTSSASIEGSNWTVHVGMPLAEYQEIGRTEYRILLATIFLIVGLLVAAAFLFQRELAARRRQDLALASGQRMEALGKLTGGVAHDFNNLLMIFQAGIEGVRRRKNDEQKLNVTLDMMSEGVSKGKAITHRLLSFSRRSNLDAETFFIQDKIGPLEHLVKQAATDQIIVDTEVDPDMWPVTVDPQGFEVAIINLVTNAREAMPDGGRLRIHGRNISEGSREIKQLRGPCVAISISDNGPGIPQADIHRVFEPFFTTKGGRSSGLGLSQVYGFAQRSGGAVVASSLPDQGASFVIYLPKAAGQVAPSSSATVANPLPRKVLVVDDTPSSLEASKMLLEMEGITVATAPSGQEALTVLASEPNVELVLSDIMMPNMSGLELAMEVQSRYPNTSIILMTGYSDALEQGARTQFPVLSKPFSRAGMLGAFAAAASQRNSASVVRLHPG
ncbi:histidine kinase (plasmid) [Rhizobium leguminosarum bv. trifolii WSM1325]|uniref:histidine kinase n=1 Tax=Rhizobium leguminosarum bv. trifolii (strain WSM1325) TaxID=395491 RepID=C6B8L1_RHILS|nr:response regulator [Rhizobium leguminosarum]ACS60249.1 histidine kinase [Rhizobium leguminosarum bv. trifolii WSM1325]